MTSSTITSPSNASGAVDPGFKFARHQGRVMSAETNREGDGGADDRDRQVFRRLGIMTVVWVILLVVAGLLLLFYGGVLTDLVV